MRTGLLISCALLLSASVAWSQAESAAEPPPTLFRTESNLVVLNVSVFDKDAKVVKGLPQTSFNVFEDDVRQEINLFRQEDVAISLGLIIDNSGSMWNKKDRVNSAALAMVKASNPDDEVLVVHFSDEAHLTQSFTSKIEDLEKSLRKPDPKGVTAMRDALALALDCLSDRPRKDKKALLVVTDGEDNASTVTEEALIEAAQRLEVIIYAVGLLGEEQPVAARRAKAALHKLTLATGGRVWFPADVDDIAKIAPEIAHEIRNQYIIGYSPTNQKEDGGYRRIRVSVDTPELAVRTRAGYYASGRKEE